MPNPLQILLENLCTKIIFLDTFFLLLPSIFITNRITLGGIMRNLTTGLFFSLMLGLLGTASVAGPYSDHLYENESLTKGQWLRSNNGQYTLVLQDDGNFVLYGRGRALWASNTEGRAARIAAMQSDGNLVIYGYPHAIWASNTHNNPGAHLVVQDDGNVVIYLARKAIWATGTN